MRINPEDFFGQVGATTEHQLNLKKSLAGYIDHGFDPSRYPSEWPRVILDGQGLSARTYPCLSSYHPMPGDRVVLSPLGAGHVIIGAVQDIPDRKLLPGTLVFKARCDLGVTTPNGSFAPIPWNEVDFDLLGGWIGVDQLGADFRSMYRPPVAGLYKLSGTTSYSSNSSGWRATSWHVNGSVIPGGFSRTVATTGTVQSHARNITVELNGINDYVEMHSSQNSGGDLALAATNDTMPHVEIVYVGPGSLTEPLPSIE